MPDDKVLTLEQAMREENANRLYRSHETLRAERDAEQHTAKAIAVELATVIAERDAALAQVRVLREALTGIASYDHSSECLNAMPGSEGCYIERAEEALAAVPEEEQA